MKLTPNVFPQGQITSINTHSLLFTTSIGSVKNFNVDIGQFYNSNISSDRECTRGLYCY